MTRIVRDAALAALLLPLLLLATVFTAATQLAALGLLAYAVVDGIGALR